MIPDNEQHTNSHRHGCEPHFNPATSTCALIEEAARLATAGLSILPIARGDKQPAEATWKHRQKQAATPEQVHSFLKNCTAYGIVGGQVSGGGHGLCLAFLDIETEAAYRAWRSAVGSLADGLPRQRTGGGGYHVAFRSTLQLGNHKLAYRSDESEKTGRKTLIEVKAEGGQVLGPGSAHPSGTFYEMAEGDFAGVPEISEAHAHTLLDAGRRLDEAPYTRQELEAQAKREAEARDKAERRAASGGSVIDAYNAAHAIGETLLASGYIPRGSRFARPGSESREPSIAVDTETNRSFHHAANDPLSNGYWQRPFDVYCKLEHGGDAKAAVKVAAQELGMAGGRARQGKSSEQSSSDSDDSSDTDIPEASQAVASSDVFALFRNNLTARPRSLPEVRAKFRYWLYMEDDGLINVVLGAVAANLMPGDPVWLMLVGSSGGGKTEILQSLFRLPFTHLAATITESSLLSGTPKKDKAKTAKGGLLREIGAFGFLGLKDFTSILSMHRDARGAVLAALREIYDGSWTRHVGSDGGQSLAWSGKVAVLAGCTDSIDSHHAVTGTMGERFAFYRLPEVDQRQLARRVLTNKGREKQMREELGEAVAGLFAGLDLPTAPTLPADALDRLIDLATLAAKCRSGVERDEKREISLVLSSESPTRLAAMLCGLFHGMTAIGVEEAAIWRALRKIALDSMHKVRRAAFDLLADGSALTAPQLATRLELPTTTVRRALEDLNAHGVVSRIKGQGQTGDEWRLTEWAQDVLANVQICVPEKSSDDISSSNRGQSGSVHPESVNSPSDFSGTQRDTGTEEV